VKKNYVIEEENIKAETKTLRKLCIRWAMGIPIDPFCYKTETQYLNMKQEVLSTELTHIKDCLWCTQQW
jgi:hypothetical protein